ncbi:MAG: tetratricopeptide repeat protein [Phycisphaerales bacterium]
MSAPCWLSSCATQHDTRVDMDALVAAHYTPGQTGSRLVPGLGTHHMAITTDSALAQQWFNQGLALAYGFNHAEAIRAFQEAAALDPNAAMAWWGIAYANGMHLNIPEMSEAQWRDSYAAAQRAIAELDDESPVERDLVMAVAQRTAWPVPDAQLPYDEAYFRAMEGVYERHPSHPDVAALFAESMMNLQPWDYWTESKTPKGRALRFIGVIERGLAANPTHPQLAHLYIHAVEAGPNPAAAERSSDMLLTRVPAAGHLVHMPSHIYARVGRYHDAVTSNTMAVEADRAFFALGTDPGAYFVYHAHNEHFLAFAAMMEGRSEIALEAARRLETSVPEPALDQFAFLIEGIMLTTRHVQIRFGMWEDILLEPAPLAKRPVLTALHHYSRGVAFAALGRTSEARAEIALFDAAVQRVPEDWWVFSNKVHDVLPIARLMLEGELAYRERRFDDAWAALSAAIEREDALVYDEPPGWMIPVRHAMGALLLEAGDPARAERLYREDLADHPGNGWSLLGLQQSLEAQGRHAEAAEITPLLDKAWAHVDHRPTSSCLCAPGRV